MRSLFWACMLFWPGVTMPMARCCPSSMPFTRSRITSISPCALSEEWLCLLHDLPNTIFWDHCLQLYVHSSTACWHARLSEMKGCEGPHPGCMYALQSFPGGQLLGLCLFR